MMGRIRVRFEEWLGRWQKGLPNSGNGSANANTLSLGCPEESPLP
jgi:hypothetical protein